jgi:hypothetical protein
VSSKREEEDKNFHRIEQCTGTSRNWTHGKIEIVTMVWS